MHDHRLQPIDRVDLPRLRDLYANGVGPTFTFNLLNNYCILLERRPDLRDLVAVSLDGDWREDGLFVIRFKNYLHFDSLAVDAKRVRVALGLLDLRSRRQLLVFNGYAERFQDTVEAVVRRNRLWTDVGLNGSYDYFELTPERLRVIETRQLPSGLRLGPLRWEHAVRVNDSWAARHERSLDLIRSYIEDGTSLGVYTTQGGHLVAWIMVQLVGAIGVLHVTPDYRQLGLGSLLVVELARRMHEQGFRVAATISQENLASRQLFMKLGFRQESLRRFYWTYVKRWGGREVEGVLGA